MKVYQQEAPIQTSLEIALIASLLNRETMLDVLIAEDTGGWCGLSALYAQRIKLSPIGCLVVIRLKLCSNTINCPARLVYQLMDFFSYFLFFLFFI